MGKWVTLNEDELLALNDAVVKTKEALGELYGSLKGKLEPYYVPKVDTVVVLRVFVAHGSVAYARTHVLVALLTGKLEVADAAVHWGEPFQVYRHVLEQRAQEVSECENLGARFEVLS